jgi:hypothetical protein
VTCWYSNCIFTARAQLISKDITLSECNYGE